MLNLLIAEDDIFFLKILVNKIVQSNKSLRVCAITTEGKETLDIIKKEKIDIILLGANLLEYNKMQILDFLEKNKKEEYLKSIIVISDEKNQIEKKANSSLIYAYISKTKMLDEIIEKTNKIIEEKEIYLQEQKQRKQKRKIILKKINSELINVGYNSKYIGTSYLSDSIYLLYFYNKRKNIKLERDIYPIIAQNNNTTTHTVKCDIIRATNQVGNTVEQEKLKKYFGYHIDTKIKPKLVMNTILRKLNYEI